MNHFSGGYISNTYNHNGINFADIEINQKKLLANDDGAIYNSKLENGEPIGVSTGLYFEGNDESGIATNGDEYYAVAKNQSGDHLAMLPDDEPPAGGEATFMRFNGENDDQTITVNVDDWISELATNEESKTLFNKIWEKCKQTFAPLVDNSDNSQDLNNKGEVDAMKREELIAALNAKEVGFKESATDAELLVTLIDASKADNSELVSTINSLRDELKEVQGKLAENTDKELDELAEKAAPLMGVEIEEAKAMGANALHKVLAKNGVIVGAPVSITNSDEPATKKMPWEE